MIAKLRVQNFRKHVDYSVDFAPGTVVITGPNGSGKTSLIEAIYIALQGKSWRSNFEEILRKDANWWRIDVEFTDGEKRTIRYENGEKSFEIDGVKSKILTAKNRKPVVLFEPNDLNLLYGSPARRREFIDRFISQIEPQYGVILRKFNRVLQQRNNLLKQNADADTLFVWDIQFADLASSVIAARQEWVVRINREITREYKNICNRDDEIKLSYLKGDKLTQQSIVNQLKYELSRGYIYTDCGPQRHDIQFMFNDDLAKTKASRGECRTIIFALLKSMIDIVQTRLGETYIIFDDIDSELDDRRKNGLYGIFNDYIFLATTIEINDGAAINGRVKL